MSNPQQPELARSRKTPAQDPDAVASIVEGRQTPPTEGRTGPVPAANQPGQHPETEQDKPDLDAFAAKLGVTDQPADEVVDRQIERQNSPLPTPESASGPPKAALAGVLAAALALFALLRMRRRRARRRH
ncbi:MAG TPA: hypothetical protein VF045_10520 [Acidimicrobiales bacterium]